MPRKFEPQHKKVRVIGFGTSIPFDLCQRRVSFGDSVEIDYHWMDSSELRQDVNSMSESQNYRNILALWWDDVCHHNHENEPDVICTRLLAGWYAGTARSHGTHRVLSDAYPQYWQSRSMEPIDGVVAPVNSDDFTAKMHQALEVKVPRTDEWNFANAMIDALLDSGIQETRSGGDEGAGRFVAKLDGWHAGRRRRGGRPLTHFLLDHLAFRAKLAFYELYGKAWSAIILTLKQKGLDETSEAFLRFWHRFEIQSLDNPMLPPGPLGGIPLAAHPLSAYLMRDLRLSAACGDFFRQLTPGDVDRHSDNSYQSWSSYKLFLGAVVEAANQYRADLCVRGKNADSRAATKTASKMTEQARIREAAEPSALKKIDLHTTLTDFLRAEKKTCEKCSQELMSTGIESRRKKAFVIARCVLHGHSCQVEINQEKLRQFLGLIPRHIPNRSNPASGD